MCVCVRACLQTRISGIKRGASQIQYIFFVELYAVIQVMDVMCTSGSWWREVSLSRFSALVLKRVFGKVWLLQVNTEHLPVPALTDNIAPHRHFPCSALSDVLRVRCGSWDKTQTQCCIRRCQMKNRNPRVLLSSSWTFSTTMNRELRDVSII